MSLPFNGISDNDLLEILNFSFYSESQNSLPYFDPRSSSDSLTDSIDPDNGLATDFLNRDVSCNYYDSTDSLMFIEPHDSNFQLLKIVSQNIRSVQKNIEEFLNDVAHMKIDVFALSETRMYDDLEQLYRGFDNYVSVFKNRSRHGGGVGFLVRRHICFELVESLSFIDDNIECIFIKFVYRNSKYLVGNVYRPPRGNFGIFLDTISRIFETCNLNFSDSKLFLVGDFNLNLLKYETNQSVQRFVHQMYTYAMCPVIRRPTRVSNFSATLLDQIWTNDCMFRDSGIIRTHITDHYTVFVTVDVPKRDNDRTDSTTVKFRKFSEINKTRFRERLSALHWEEIFANFDVITAYDQFYTTLFNIFNECFPICKKEIKAIDREKPYINEDIKKLLKEKRRVLKLYNKHPITYGSSYREIRNKVNSAVQAAKRRYYQNEFLQNERDPRGMWKVINDIFGRQKPLNYIPKLVTHDGTFTENLDKANALNNYFCNIGSSLNGEVPRATRNFTEFMPRGQTEQFKFESVEESEVIEIVNSLRNVGAGYDEIPMFIYKNHISHLSKVITHICNLSLSQGLFPPKLAIAKVNCIFKAGDKTDPTNYRPISVLPAFSKILEKVVEVRLSKHMTRNRLLTSAQFGFRRGRGTDLAVHSVVRYMHTIFNENKFGLGIFIDLKKAFDSLDRDILLQKLRFYGITDAEWNWFKSYLDNRRQATMCEFEMSDFNDVKYGVPQGGILSPLLFLIYLNDIINCCRDCQCVLFADDTSLYLSSNNIENLIVNANFALNKYKEWFDANKLTLNAKKTQYMIFHRKQRAIPHTNLKIMIDMKEIEKVNKTKFLGVTLDCNLSWNDHVVSITQKVSKYVPIIRKVSSLCNFKSLKLIYNCLIYSNLIYCNSIWGSCKDIALKPLTLLHKRIVRAMARVHSTYHTHELYVKFSMLNLRQINSYMVGIFVYKCTKDSEFTAWFPRPLQVRTTRSTENELLMIPQIPNEHSRQCISYRGPKVYNDISVEVRKKSYNGFKISYKKVLLSDY